MKRSRLLLAAVLVLAARAGTAQSLYAFDPTLTVSELTGPAGGPCLYPNGPVNSFFPAGPGACPGPGPFLPPMGDVAVNNLTDTIYVTNGAVISAYSRFGVHLGTALPPIPGLTGMGVGVGGVLWITDGFIYGAVPLGLGCPVAPLPFVIGPFPVPIGPIFAGPLGDIEWDTASASLVGCDATGLVGNWLPGGAALGPYGVFAAPAGCIPGPLVGIAMNKALPGSGTVYVTNGAAVARLIPPGFPAPPTFYSPLPCFPVLTAAPIVGLAYAGRQITYGAGLDNSGLPAPFIDAVGESFVGNGAYAITLTGSVPGGTAFLRYSFVPACPPLFVLGVPFYLGAPRFPLATVIVGAGGTASVAAPIPAAVPIPLGVYLQWIVLTGSSLQVTSGAEFSTILP